MKNLAVSLSLLALVACGKKGSSNDNETSTPTVGVTPGTTLPVETPTNVKPTTPGNNANQSAVRPALGFYLGACETETNGSVSSGVNVTATAVYPVTVLFSSIDCVPTTISAWGHTDEFSSYANYIADVKATALTAGNTITSSFDASAIHFKSIAGTETAWKKVNASLTEAKRLSIYINSSSYDANAVSFQGTAILNKGPLLAGSIDIGVYCEDSHKKIQRQESSFTFNAATNVVSFKGLLNTWESGQISLPTRCLVTLVALQKVAGQDRAQDVAWSQFVDVK